MKSVILLRLRPCSQMRLLLLFLFLLLPFTARNTFAWSLFEFILLLENCRRKLDSIFWNFGFHILAGITIRAENCRKRIKYISAEI